MLRKIAKNLMHLIGFLSLLLSAVIVYLSYHISMSVSNVAVIFLLVPIGITLLSMK